jgi:hypothetical protein
VENKEKRTENEIITFGQYEDDKWLRGERKSKMP